ncbi:MAG: DUF6398 domain-containing protein [Planctomycetota bacterium]|nr:DUF6398 domain-containing protein [Planctomycetota bacterium]
MKKRTKMKNSEETDMEIREELELTFVEIVTLTDEFCRNHLNEDYQELCVEMANELVDIEIPLHRGRPASWASGLVHAVGYVNFLHDHSQSPHMTSPQIAKGFGVSQGTMQSKSKIIRDELDLMPFDPDWCLPTLLEDNPLVWMLDINGFAIDIRTAPREAQEEAYRLGLIPYIPADREKPEPPPDSGTKIIQFPSGHNKTASTELPRKTQDDGPTLFDGQQ